MLSGILHVLRNGLSWQDAASVYGPHKTLYDRFLCWSRRGVFARIFRVGDILMIDSTHLEAHRTEGSLREGGRGRGPSGAQETA